jgi:LmbE family N-acetylglucosaminyl deacetylase
MSFCLSTSHLAAMARAGVVVLSPHFDDACFSVGGLLQAVGGGELVNVFNRSTYLARPVAGLSAPSEAQVQALREAEDVAFATRCGLQRTALGGAEPGFHGRRPGDLAAVEHDIAAMQDAVIAALLARAPATGPRAYLLAPMAVGRHVNHHAVHAIVARQRDTLSPHFHLCFYEDLPYANDPLQRSARLRAFASAWPGWQRQVYRPGWPRKRELIALYPTQLKREPARWKFRPASVWPWAVHEAVWMATDAWAALH